MTRSAISRSIHAAALGVAFALPCVPAWSAAPASTPTAAAPTPEAGFTQRGAHVHGKVVVNIALEGKLLSVLLEAPAINVTGFERAPRGAAEQRTVAIVDRWLASGAGILSVPANAACKLAAAEYDPPRLGAAAAHDHEHEHESAGGDDHAEYDARYTYDCGNPAALAWVELALVQRLRNVAEIEVNLATPRGQSQKTLGAEGGRIALR